MDPHSHPDQHSDPENPASESDPVAGESGAPAQDRFPTIVLAGPGCLSLLFVLAGSGAGGANLMVSASAAIGASIFFGVIASRSRDKNAQTLWVLAAFLGPVLFCLTLMSRL